MTERLAVPRSVLPNGLEVAYQSKAELGHFYEDIFEKRVYVRNGITLREGDIVFDVGANIGLCTLFISLNYKDVTVYSFEPAAPLFEILRANTSQHAPFARLFNFGLGAERKQAEFTFYPNSPGMSSFYGDEREEKEVLRAIMLNESRRGMAGAGEVIKHADDILEERFKSQTITCRLETLSDFMREHHVERVDLLKIDVQKSEYDVLLGVEEEDWKKIRQVVLEVHDLDGRLGQIEALLERLGFQVVAEQDEMYEGSVLYNLYATRREEYRAPDSQQLLVLSAESADALERETSQLVAQLRENPGLDLAELAYALQTGAGDFAHRRMLVCLDHADALKELESANPRRVLTSSRGNVERHVAFMFPGLGNHYVNMARDLYDSEPVFREVFDQCCELLKPHLGLDLREIVYPARPDAESESARPGLDLRRMLRRDEPADDEAERLNQSLYSQPALFVTEYALARLWMSRGIVPEAMIGYSIGEYVAACLSDVLSLEDALLLVAQRARLIQELPGGAMLAVALSEEELVVPILNPHLSISADNGPFASVVGGPVEAVEEIQLSLTQRGVACQRLHVKHAFHTEMMSPILQPLAEVLRGVKLHPPKIPYLSNVTGTWITESLALDPGYWCEHLCKAVRFGDGARELWKRPGRLLLEVGPGQALCAWAMQAPEDANASERVALSSLRHSFEQQSDKVFMLNTLGRLWLSGVRIDWPALHAHGRRHAPAPVPAPAPSEQERELQHQPPGPAPTRAHLHTPYVAPRNAAEEYLVRLWGELLSVEQVGIYDNFFFLGGDSLTATRLLVRVNETFSTELTLRDIFNAPTVADLASIFTGG